MTPAKKVLLEALESDGHPERVEDVIFWALQYYASSEPKGTKWRLVAKSLIDRLQDEKRNAASSCQRQENDV